MVAQELIILWAGHPGSLCPGTEHVLSFSLNCTCWLKYFPRKMNKLSEKPHSLSLEMCYCVKVSNMSLFSEMSGLFPFSPQVHRQARVGICGKWHWNSRNQQFCTGIDPLPLPSSAIFVYAYLLCPCSLDIYGGVFIVLIACATQWALFVIFVPPQHSDKVLMASGWTCGELNLVGDFSVQV